jgi:glucan biosynthesis protein
MSRFVSFGDGRVGWRIRARAPDPHDPGDSTLRTKLRRRRDQAYRMIRTSKLNALLRLHTWPIDVVVFHDPQGYLVSRRVSRLDAFSGYLFST